MDRQPSDEPTPAPDAGSAAALLDAFGAHPEWTERQRDEQLERLVVGVPADRLRAEVLGRLHDLTGSTGEALLRLIEIDPDPALLDALAGALVAQPGLPPERAWEALSLLDGAGLLVDYPELAARWDELAEVLDEDDSLDQLAEQIEGDPEGRWLALQGLGAVEPEIRPQIIAGLARMPIGPGLAEFLRLLCFAHDPVTRAAALDALEQADPSAGHVAAAWSTIAAEHPDPQVSARARRRLGSEGGRALAAKAGAGPAPTVVRSLVTALDGRGRGSIVLASRRGPALTVAAFVCDVRQGVREVTGHVESDLARADDVFAELAGQADLETVEGSAELALVLLAGTVLLCGPDAPPALRYWLEQTVPEGFRPRPFPAPLAGWDPASLPAAELPGRVRSVLEACPSWLDDSPLTYEIAEEIALREQNAQPDPRRDAGAYRYLFEHRLVDQLELYRRMLYWMALFWQAAGDDDRARSALALAWQLSDAQHAVPGHPFTVALATRSLTIAQTNLRRGVDRRRLSSTPGA